MRLLLKNPGGTFLQIQADIYFCVAHRRTGRGGEGAAAPPKFGQLRFFGQQENFWAKLLFKDVSMFLLLLLF